MKRICGCFLVVLGLAIFGQAQRLPETATPSSYKLTFSPNFTNDTFGGDEVIEVKVASPTPKIVLNAAEIKFDDVTIDAGGKSQKATVTTDENNEMATLTVPNPIPAGAATIRINYNGILNDKLRGFYLSKTDKRKYAVTQFEATDARRAFPSFDEPAYKATFDISIIVDNGDTAISNGELVSDTPGPGAGKHTSSSHDAEVVHVPRRHARRRLECVCRPGRRHPAARLLRPGQASRLGHFRAGSRRGRSCITTTSTSRIKYPFGKLDQVAMPDFEAGAMENAGAITYRETLLLATTRRFLKKLSATSPASSRMRLRTSGSAISSR